MQSYSFNVQYAAQYGVDEAIMIHNLQFWISKNVANGKHYYDGRTWTYNSLDAFTELFPFWSRRQIERILKSLTDQGVIIKGNHSQTGYDRTRWYAFVDEVAFIERFQHIPKRGNGNHETGKSIPPDEDINITDRGNGNHETGTPITDIKPNNKTNEKTDNLAPVNYNNNGEKLDKCLYIKLLKKDEKNQPLTKTEREYVAKYERFQMQEAGIPHEEEQGKHTAHDALPPEKNPYMLRMLGTLQQKLGEATFQSWFVSMRFDKEEGGQVILTVGTGFIKRWITEKYMQEIDLAFRVAFPEKNSFGITTRA